MLNFGIDLLATSCLCLNPPNPCLHASRCVQANGRTPDLKSAWRTCFRWPIPTARGRERKKHSTPPSTAVTTWRADLPLKFLVTNQIKIVASGECKTTGLPAIYFCFLRVCQPRVCVGGRRERGGVGGSEEEGWLRERSRSAILFLVFRFLLSLHEPVKVEVKRRKAAWNNSQMKTTMPNENLGGLQRR